MTGAIGFLGTVVSNASLRSKLAKAQIRFDPKAWKEWPEKEMTLSHPSLRQAMVKDLVARQLPGPTKHEIEVILGVSLTRHEMERPSNEENLFNERAKNSSIPTSSEYYFDDHEWDLIYEIEIMREPSLTDPIGPDGDAEYPLIRVNDEGKFESWYIVGNSWWTRIVG